MVRCEELGPCSDTVFHLRSLVGLRLAICDRQGDVFLCFKLGGVN
jgi:hypothetical protein